MFSELVRLTISILELFAMPEMPTSGDSSAGPKSCYGLYNCQALQPRAS